MSTLRRIDAPATAALAAAVAVLALGGCSSSSGSSGSSTSPGAQGEVGAASGAAGETGADDETVEVRRGDLSLTFSLDAATADGTDVALTPTDRARLVLAPGVRAGAVTRGTPLGTLRTGGQGVASTPERPVVAPVDGELRTDEGRPVVRAPGLDVVAPMTPIQFLRFLSLPFRGEAQVETVLGPTKVACEALWTEAAPEGDAESAASLRCRLPQRVESAPGLRSTLTIAADPVTGVLLVPNLFIGDDAAGGGYFVVPAAAPTTRIPVRVGASDGVVRVVEGDLDAGTRLTRPPTPAEP